jgi:hypothetical protein
MKKILSICIFLTLCHNGFTQIYPTWGIQLGGYLEDYIKDLAVDKSGNSFVCGTFKNLISFSPGISLQQHNGNFLDGGYCNSFIAKYDENGLLVWGKAIDGSTGQDYNGSYGAVHIVLDELSNVYVMGKFGDTIYFDGNPIIGYDSDDRYLIKLDSSGQFLWSKVFSSTNDGEKMALCYSAGQLHLYTSFSSNSIITTDTIISQTTDKWSYIFSFDTSGSLLSLYEFQGIDSANIYSGIEISSMKSDNSGNLYLHGYVWGKVEINNYSIGDYDTIFQMYLAKFDANENLIFKKKITANTDMTNTPHPMAIDNNENIYLTGTYYRDTIWFDNFSIYKDSQFNNAFCLKIDSTGNYNWVNNINTTITNCIFKAGNNIYITGWNTDTSFYLNHIITTNGYRTFLFLIDSIGNFVTSSQNYPWNSASCFNSGCADSSQNVYIISSITGPVGYLNVLARMFSSYGEFDGILVKITNLTTSIENNGKNNQITISPNPTKDLIYITSKHIFDFKLYDLTGKVIMEYKSQSDLKIDLSNYSNGVYVLQFNNESGQFYEKIIKQ